MRLHRFIGKFNLDSDKIRISDPNIIGQIKNVLRLKAGDLIILADGDLNEAKCRILNLGKNDGELEVVERYKNLNEPQGRVILYCAVLKKENFELVVQKATEIGVGEIVPVITERTVKLNLRKDRLEKIIREASEQSGRGILPILRDTVDFEQALLMAKVNDPNFIFDSSGESFSGSFRLNSAGSIGVWVGPEGGWTGQELTTAQGSNLKIINLGKLTLRAETAAIVAIYAVVNNLHCR